MAAAVSSHPAGLSASLFARLREAELCEANLRAQISRQTRVTPKMAGNADRQLLALDASNSKNCLLFKPFISAAIGRGDMGAALELLELLAFLDPENPWLLRQVRVACQGLERPEAGQALIRCLVELIGRDQACAGAGANNLLAVAAFELIRLKRNGQARSVLSRIGWRAVGRPRYFLGRYAELYWNDHGDALKRMIEGLGERLEALMCGDLQLQIAYGHACKFAGDTVKAATLLLPVLHQILTFPDLFLSTLEVLILAGCQAELRVVLNSKKLRSAVEAVYDAGHMAKLAGLLFNAGFRTQSRRLFRTLAGHALSADAQELPRLVFALANLGDGRYARRLLKAFEASLAQELTDFAVLSSLSEAWFHAGCAAKARRRARTMAKSSAIPATGFPAAFMLLERAGLLSELRGLMRQRFGETFEATPEVVPYLYSCSLYGQTLGASLAKMLRNQEKYRQDFLYGFFLMKSHFFLGDFSSAAQSLEFLRRSPGLSEYLSHYEAAQLDLAGNAYASAGEHLKHCTRMLKADALNLEARADRWLPYFDLALLERIRGNGGQALKVAEECLCTWATGTNPLHGVKLLLLWELQGRRPTVADARRISALAVNVAFSRHFAEPWLYLVSALIWADLGQGQRAVASFRQMLSRCLYLNDPKRLLPFAYMIAQPECRGELLPMLQSAFFPHFRNTYFNQLLEFELRAAPAGRVP